MDWWIVKQLRAMILTDLRDFVPPGYFESEAENFKLDSGITGSDYFSHELRWGYLAGDLGRRLFFESTAIMSARQVSASEVLMNLGMLAGAEAAQGVTTRLAEYALRGVDKPIGVSTFELTRALPAELESSLPSIEQIERELRDMDTENSE